jgi:hypothetical protein
VPEQISREAVVVSKPSFKSSDPYDLISSNISFLNALFEEHLRHAEVSSDALRSYYVDYYLAEVNNGGFSQFVYNSRWEEEVVKLVREGLRAMGAQQHLALFEKVAGLVKRLGKKGLRAYLASEYFGDNAVRDNLNAPNEDFFAISKQEDLIVLNSAWLRGLPNLMVLTIPQMEKEVKRRAEAIPDRAERIAEARASEPRYVKLIRALCERAGQQFEQVTAGDPAHKHAGRETLAWYFFTDRGLHYMVEADGKALMFRETSKKKICEVDAPDEE